MEVTTVKELSYQERLDVLDDRHETLDAVSFLQDLAENQGHGLFHFQEVFLLFPIGPDGL